MKVTLASVFPCLLNFFIFVAADLDRELRKSLDTVMKCRFREPPKGPVMAVTPARFVQVVVLLHERFDSPTCFRPSKSPINISDQRTWPFCIFGKCNKGACQCAGNFVGPKCSTYSKKCWLMYCYLTSCHPSHQSLHCVCDPTLYGTEVLTGIYWYDQGKHSKFVPPPPRWEDEPVGMIKLKSDSDIDKGRGGDNAPSGSLEYNADRRKMFKNVPGRNSNRGFASSSRTGQKISSPNQNVGGRKSGFRSNVQELEPSSSKRVHKGDKEEGVGAEEEKTDVDEALEQLENVSPAWRLNASLINLLLFIVFNIACWIRRMQAV